MVLTLRIGNTFTHSDLGARVDFKLILQLQMVVKNLHVLPPS
jgi:hypothetical protein